MTAPFPPEVVAGVADPAVGEAANLYSDFAWLARLYDLMDVETDLDLKKVYQLVLHSRKFRQWYDALQARIPARSAADIGLVISSVMAAKGVVWASLAAMNADLSAIYTHSQTVSTWADNNAGAYRDGYSVNKVVSDDVTTDDPLTATKTPQIATFLATGRALWGAR